MVLIYEETRSASSRGLYSETYPSRRRTTHGIILRTINSYREGRNPGRKCSKGRPRTSQEDQVVLHQVAEDPTTSVRLIERRTVVAKSQAQRILKRYEYHIQRVQTL
nr:unnamed protein product [Callosobruchus chinensis]